MAIISKESFVLKHGYAFNVDFQMDALDSRLICKKVDGNVYIDTTELLTVSIQP